MTARIAVLVDERDRPLGKTTVPDATFVIRHMDALYVRTDKGMRLTRAGIGMGIIFQSTEVYERDRLEPL